MKNGAGKSKSKRAGKERFHITHFINPSGETVYRVAGYQPEGARVRENFRTHEEAIGRKAQLDVEAANIVTTTATRLKATRMTDEQVKDAERAVAKLGPHSLLVAAEYFLANYHEPFHHITVAKAVDQFIADREKQNRRPDTIRSLRGRLGRLCRLHGQKQTAEITTEDCRAFVFRENTSPCNQKNDRLALSNFLNWCVRRQYAVTNNINMVDKPTADAHEPKALSVADCRNLLAAAVAYKEGVLLPYTVIALFAGLRPTEIARLTWDRVDLTDATIMLDGTMAKNRQRRIVELPENAVAWLLPLAPKRPEFRPAAFARHFARVKKTAGFNGREGQKPKEGKPALRPWVPDYLRHTAISMYLAKHKHEGEAATWAGNSPNVIHRHYKGLVKEADAAEFWSITPETVKTAIVAFPAQAAA